MKRVMIVDDSKQIRERIAALLAGSNRIRIVGEAGNAHDALDAFKKHRPDTVILDIQLPDQSGIEVLKKIKALQPEVDVTMMTNFDNVQYREQCRRLGADHFLNKTLEFEKIIDTVLDDLDHEKKEVAMEEFKNILVVTHTIKESQKVLRTGISLARKYGGTVHVLHVIHDPFNIEGWNLPVPSFEEEYRNMVSKAREKLLKEIVVQKAEDLVANIWVKDGRPPDEIQRAVEAEKIDLVLIPAHPEGRLEHFLFGKENDALIRQLPTSIMLVK